MSLISARSAWDWAAKLGAEYDEPFDLVLRDILAAVDHRDVSARNPDDPVESWRILLPVMIEHIDRDRRGLIDPEPLLGPGILVMARSILIDSPELGRWLTARGIERRDPPVGSQPAGAPASSGQGDEPVISETGLPGRPSKGKHLIEDEAERRRTARQTLTSLADEARALLDWYKQSHPDAPRPTLKTIKNNIRNRHRRYLGSAAEP
jgi:hypothetical protein